MMLIICDESPVKSAAYLIKHTNKNFCFKSLLELSQLICSCEISSVYKAVKQGYLLKEWVRKYPSWVYPFFSYLFQWAKGHVRLKEKTVEDMERIEKDLYKYSVRKKLLPETAIFRYVKEYEEFTEYPTNAELPIDVAVKEYEKYVEFKKDKWDKE